MDDLSVLRGAYIKNSLSYNMMATKIITKTTKPSFFETQFLKLKASKNKAFVLAMIATLVVFIK